MPTPNQNQTLDPIAELAALTRQRELMMEVFATEKRMMALGPATGQVWQMIRTISMVSQGVNINHPPQINQRASSHQKKAASQISESENHESQRRGVPLIG